MIRPFHNSSLAWWFAALCAFSLAAIACAIPAFTGPTPTPEFSVFTATPETAIPPTDLPTQPAATPTAGLVGYTVVFVAEDDILNARTGAGVGSPVKNTIPYNMGRGAGPFIFITGPGQVVDGSEWVPVESSAELGWVNRHFLTEAVDTPVFCADPQAEAVIANLISAVGSKDGAAIAALVHPDRGLYLRTAWWNPEVHLTRDEVAGIFTDTAVRDWGTQAGSGFPITGATAQVIIPDLATDITSPSRETACNQILAASTTGLVVIPPEYGGFNYISIHRPPLDQADNVFDWGTWAAGIEYHDGQPYLVYLIHYEYEI